MNGVIMQRVLGLAIATFAFSSLSGVRDTREAQDVAALLTAARGAPPIICSLASRALRGLTQHDLEEVARFADYLRTAGRSKAAKGKK